MAMAERLGASPRASYALSGVLNAALLWGLNVTPGWQNLPFLTPAAAEVLGLVNVSLGLALMANILLLILTSALLRGLREALVATLGLAVLARLFVVFPFPLPEGTTGRILVQGLLLLAMAGTFIALISGWGLVARALFLLSHPPGGRGRRSGRGQGT